MKQKVGFVGLGTMGAPMAGHLLEKGFDLQVWNRTEGKDTDLIRRGATRAANLQHMGEECQIVCLCVRATEDVEACVDDLTVSASENLLIVDHSTISLIGARRIHEVLNSRRIGFLDAPITGGSMGAIKGTLTVFCGGSPENFERAKTVMSAYSKRCQFVGGPGAGQMTKIANQIAVAGSLIGLCESLAFAEEAGLDVALTRDLLSGGAAGSWALDNYGPKILSKDWSPGFTVSNQHKDLAYCIEAGDDVGSILPMTELVKRLLAEMMADGRGNDASCALYEHLRNKGIDT